MKKINLLLIIIFISITGAKAQYQNNWALGIKIGEPLGLNIRKYFNDGENVFDVNIGTFGFLYGRNRSYRNEVIYEEGGLMVQGLYSFQKNLFNSEKNHVYYGFGGQLNSRNRPLGTGNRDTFKAISLGPAANCGLELAIPNSDLGFFIDGGIYTEIVPKPLFVNLQGNFGFRLNLIK
jgi:hypothetical protein